MNFPENMPLEPLLSTQSRLLYKISQVFGYQAALQSTFYHFFCPFFVIFGAIYKCQNNTFTEKKVSRKSDMLTINIKVQIWIWVRYSWNVYILWACFIWNRSWQNCFAHIHSELFCVRLSNFAYLYLQETLCIKDIWIVGNERLKPQVRGQTGTK